MLNYLTTFIVMKKIYVLLLALMACEDPKVVIPKNPDTNKEYEQFGIPFDKVADPENVVIYEVNVRAFSSQGDLQGVMDRLDHIKSLGVNTIWLMPIHPVGQEKSAFGLGSPYAVQNYLEVNPDFGDLAKLRALVELAHEKDMAVIIDWVANHTAWDNPWIQNKSWYTQDAAGNIVIPAGTNWQDVADLNFDNVDMRKAMINAMRYWVLEANIDGFRCDAADFVPADFWKEALDALKLIENRKLILLAEGSKPEQFTAGFQINYAWDFYYNLKQVFNGSRGANTVFTTHLSEYNQIPDGAIKLRYTTNHDESAWEGTPIEFFGGKEGALSASVITLFTSSAPLIYGSQEVGRANKLAFFTKDPIDWSANANMLETYQQLMSIYVETETFTKGDLKYYSNYDLAIFKRSYDQEEYLILANVRGQSKKVTLAEELQNSTWTNQLNGEQVLLGVELELPAYAYLILKK